MSLSEQERARVEHSNDDKQASVAQHERRVLEYSADHRTQQIRAESNRRRTGIAETLRKDEVGEKYRSKRQAYRRGKPRYEAERQQAFLRNDPRHKQRSEQ